MAKIDLSKYGISGTTEIVHNPSYELLFEEETKPELEGLYSQGRQQAPEKYSFVCRDSSISRIPYGSAVTAHGSNGIL